MTKPLRIANCSGFFGDRVEAAREMVEGGPIDVLTGDYLAELTMAILLRQRMRDPDSGYVRTFLSQLEDVLGTCMDRGIRIVTNAGGLNPDGLATAVGELADRLGLSVKVASVAGDDLMPRLGELGGDLTHLDTGETPAQSGVDLVTANAYLGGWGITDALAAGANVVVTGRVSDASLVTGPAAWHFDWNRDDWDSLAGAVVAGHVIECGAQATGGNYSFFAEVPNLLHPGFPIAEVHRDGSSVITKHPGTGGIVSVGTVTAQLLYEIGPAGSLIQHDHAVRCRCRPGRDLGSAGDATTSDHQGLRCGARRFSQLDDRRVVRTRHRGQGGGRTQGAVAPHRRYRHL